MARCWADDYAQCPYYHCAKINTGGNIIKCDGIQAHKCYTDIVFRNREDFTKHLKSKCCREYKRCDVYQMLNAIYDPPEE